METLGNMRNESKSNRVTVHRLTHEPNEAWDSLNQTAEPVARLVGDESERPVNSVRFVCVSDTHDQLRKVSIPDGDVLLHAGDFTMTGTPASVHRFNKELGLLPHRHKIVIAGNHELSFDPATNFNKRDIAEMKAILTNCHYLEDESTVVNGIKIYGSPWQPEFRNWAFNAKRGQQCLSIWDKIPTDTDVLITHGPPVGYGDVCLDGDHTGCVELLSTIQNVVKPSFHVYGHIHEGYGITTDGHTTFINASICTANYRPINRPIVFDFPLSKVKSN